MTGLSATGLMPAIMAYLNTVNAPAHSRKCSKRRLGAPLRVRLFFSKAHNSWQKRELDKTKVRLFRLHSAPFLWQMKALGDLLRGLREVIACKHA